MPTTLSQLTLPVKSGSTIKNITYDLPSGGGSGGSSEVFIGTCTTAAATKDKVATVDSSFSLTKGVRIGIKFSNTNTYSSATSNPITLNVNSTGAKNIWYNSTHSGAGNTGTNTTAYGAANIYSYYVYDGTYWVFDGRSVDANSTYSPQSLGIGYGTCTTAYATTAKVATLSGYNLVTNGIVAVKFTNAVNSSATLNINSKGAKPIKYRGSAIGNNVIKAGDTVTFIYDGSNYNVLSVDNLFEAFVLLTGDSEAVVTVTNSSAGISDTVILNVDGYGTYHVTQPGTYVFSVT